MAQGLWFCESMVPVTHTHTLAISRKGKKAISKMQGDDGGPESSLDL
jgi:hypothetical protein